MRNFKRFLALMLTVLMVAGCFAIPTSAAASDKFDDVDQYVDAIDTLAAIGVVTGKSETTFGTDEAVQRYQAALLFARALTGKTDNAVWQTGVNNSVFADLDENPQDLFVNAISYANNNGIVTGKSATKFAPRDGITLEQGLTMAVRALGYETAAMKASATTGLWMYIDKAISLGLDAGLEDITDYKATLTRGQMAQLIYNMIFVETADGYTYAAKAFNLITETFVLTATNTKTYDIGVDQLNGGICAPGYVGLTVLAEDGSLGKTYYFEAETLKALLGTESANFDAFVGYSYNVIADDTLANIYAIDQNTVKVFENTLDATAFTVADTAPNAFTLDGTAYTLVEKYTSKLWNKNVKNTAANEVLFYNWSEPQAASEKDAYYYYDANGNIVSKDGTILMYLVANGGVTGTFTLGKTYMVKDETTGTYRLPTATDWANATYYMTTATGAKYYAQKTANSQIAAYDKLFAEIVAIDDDGDDKYDRMFYTEYKFGQYTLSTDGKTATINHFDDTPAVTLTVASTTYTGKPVAAGNYIVYAVNTTLPELDVKDVLTAKTGYVNGFNVLGKTITIDGATLNIDSLAIAGPIDLKGVLGANEKDNWGAATDDLIGRYVTYYQIGNDVVAFANANKGAYLVFDGIVTVAADNNLTVKAYLESNVASLINVASLNGYPLSTNALGGYNMTLNYVYSTLLDMDKGTLLTYAKDANNMYHLYTVTDKNGAIDAKLLLDEKHDLGGTAVEFGKYGVANLTTTAGTAATFQANANTVFVFATSDVAGTAANESGAVTFKGVPAENSSFDGYSELIVKTGDNALATFVYVLDADNVTDSFKGLDRSTVVYIDDKHTVLENTFADKFNGTLWSYTYAIDLTTGAYTPVKSASARLLDEGFYAVKDGYAIEKLPTPTAIKVDSLGTVNETFKMFVPAEDIATVIALDANGSVITKDLKVREAITSYKTYDVAKAVADEANDNYYKAYAFDVTVNGVAQKALVLLDGAKTYKYSDDAKTAFDAWKAAVAAEYKFTVDAKKAQITLGYEDKATKKYENDIQTVIVAPKNGTILGLANDKTINGKSALGLYVVDTTTVNGDYKVTLKAKYTDGKYYDIETSDAITIGYDAKAELIKAVKADYTAKVENRVITVEWKDIDSMTSFILVGENIGTFQVSGGNNITRFNGDFEEVVSPVPSNLYYTITADSVMEDATVTLVVDGTIIDTWVIEAAN